VVLRSSRGALQTLGLLIATVEDVDINLYAKNHASATLIWVLALQSVAILQVYFKGVWTGKSPTVWTAFSTLLGFLPAAHLLLFFRGVIEMKQGFLRFTEIFVVSFAVGLFNLAVDQIDGAPAPFPPTLHWPVIVQSGMYFASVAILVLFYAYRRNKQDNLTLRFVGMIYVYLFSFGFCDLVGRLLRAKYMHKTYPMATYVFGLVHILFASTFLSQRPWIYHNLGRYWIKARHVQGACLDLALVQEYGSLIEVEEAIASDADLNEYVRQTLDDSYTLLHLAVFNAHHDSVKRLLTMPAVAINKGTAYRGLGPLFLACNLPARRLSCSQNEMLALAELLIEHGADVNAKANDGTSVVLEATACSNTELLKVLIDGGATQGEWYGLSPGEVGIELQRSTACKVLTSYESHFAGKILDEERIPCVASWPDIYAKLWDQLVAKGKASELSAAVIFLPQNTLHYGKWGSDKCYCVTVLRAQNLRLSLVAQPFVHLHLHITAFVTLSPFVLLFSDVWREEGMGLQVVSALARAHHEGRLAGPAPAGFLLRRPIRQRQDEANFLYVGMGSGKAGRHQTRQALWHEVGFPQGAATDGYGTVGEDVE
jgi:hypothetical protein